MRRNKKIVFFLSLFILLFSAQTAKATPSAISETVYNGMKKVSFQSDCTEYTRGGWSGEDKPQLPQNIYYNPVSTGNKDLIWFQHGDSSNAPRKACENRFSATSVLNDTAGKDFVIFCPEMNKSNGITASGNTKSYWSEHYADFFQCLYNDFLTIASGKGLTVTQNTIFASHSQGGPATSHITTNIAKYPNIKVIKILRFDSCYGNQCLEEANIPESQRGSLITYVSDVHAAGHYANNEKNKAATIAKKIWEKPNTTVYLVDGKDHTQVPQLCSLDFLKNNSCSGTATLQGGANTAIAGSSALASASAVGSVSAPGVFSEIKLILQKPNIKIKIPGLSFTDNFEVTEGEKKYILVPFLGEYLAGLYKYGVVVASIFAVVMIIISGFRWSMSGGSPEKIKESQTRIMQSLIGLFLAVGSYMLLYNINPELVEFKNLRVQTVKGVPLGADYSSGVFDSNTPFLLTPLNSADINAELAKYQGKGCGKNLTEIASVFASKTICEGSCHCANFVSRVLGLSGCPKEILTNSAHGLRNNLIKAGWILKKGQAGAQPGDIALYDRTLEKQKGDINIYNKVIPKGEGTAVTHIEVIVQGGAKPKSIGSNVDMRACWGDKANQIEKKCGSFWQIAYWAGYEKTSGGRQLTEAGKTLLAKYGYNTTNWVETKKQYAQCVASMGGCAPWADPKWLKSSCDYCDFFGGTPNSGVDSDKWSDPNVSDPVDSGCSTRQCVQLDSTPSFTHYLVNPNR
ncbi:MAG: pilin [Candidatus Magasanikbacteria bacterium]